MINFDNPLWLLVLPIWLIAAPLLQRRLSLLAALAYAFDGSQEACNSHEIFSKILFVISRLCFLLAVSSLIIALAAPSRTREHQIFANSGAEMIFVLDLSPSMGVINELGESRLERSINEIKLFLRDVPNISVGLVGFASEAVLLTPTSLDHYVLEERLNSVSNNVLGDSTAIGAGLLVAANHLRATSAQEQIIVLISDGGNNTGAIAPLTALNFLKERGIQLYIIALEPSADRQVYIRDPLTGRLYEAELNQQEDWQILKEAVSGWGQFFSVSSLEELKESMLQIQQQSPQQQVKYRQVSRKSLHGFFVFVAIILIVISHLISRLFLKEIL